MGWCVHEAAEKWGGESKGADEKWGGESVTVLYAFSTLIPKFTNYRSKLGCTVMAHCSHSFTLVHQAQNLFFYMIVQYMYMYSHTP